MFFTRKRNRSQLEPGSLYVRDAGALGSERAEVVEIANDGLGIPHVRYRLTHIKGPRTMQGGERVLAVSCFMDRFQRQEHAA